MAIGAGRYLAKNAPNRHELKGKTGPQHPPGVLNTPNAAFFDL
jgi:hypothetical protein